VQHLVLGRDYLLRLLKSPRLESRHATGDRSDHRGHFEGSEECCPARLARAAWSPVLRKGVSAAHEKDSQKERVGM
jgi:hypothetical protein